MNKDKRIMADNHMLQFLFDFFAVSRDAYLILDRGLSVIYVNPPMEKWFNLNWEGPIEKPCIAEFPWLEKSLGFKKYYAGNYELPQHWEEFCPTMDLWVEASIYPLKNEGHVVCMRDITARKQKELELGIDAQRFAATKKIGFDNVSIISADLRQLQKLTGKGVFSNMENLEPSSMEKYIYPDDWPVFFEEASKAYIHKIAFDLEHRALKEDGGIIWAHSRGVPILDENGDIVEWVVIVNDITHKKEYEMMQREMILKLCEADEQKNDFISALSHELRNPLMAITMSISLMEQVNPGSEPDLHAREILQRQVAQMVRLIDDLMDITRINRDKLGLVKESIEVNASIKEIMDDFQAQFENKGLVLQEQYYDAPLYISADPARLKQVMGNLLSNSLKFTEKGGLVRVLISADDETNEAFIRVADTGIGIAPELLPKLFEQFIQADNTPGRNAGGLGLGLSIVKGIIDLHGGSITVNSGGKGRGTEFLIRLPLLKQEKQ